MRIDEGATPRTTSGGILEIINEAIEHTTAIWRFEPTTFDEHRAWFRRRRDFGYSVRVPEGPARRMLGFASYGEFRPHERYRHTIEHSIYVDAAEPGRNIGIALLSALIDCAFAAGVQYFDEGRRERLERGLFQRLQTLGYKVTLEPTTSAA